MLVIKKQSEARCDRNCASEYRSLSLAKLVESKTNPRKELDEVPLEELAKSTRMHGVFSPLVVRTMNRHFEIVAGARRRTRRSSRPNHELQIIELSAICKSLLR